MSGRACRRPCSRGSPRSTPSGGRASRSRTPPSAASWIRARFLHEVLAGGRTLVLPRVDRAARRLALHEVLDLDGDLQPGTWGIPEPAPDRCRPVEPVEIDFVLVPGLVFDPGGGRIGYGAGYYDRLLGAWPPPVPPLVAAAFELQVVPAVPVLPTDRRVDLVVTESRTYAAHRLEHPNDR